MLTGRSPATAVQLADGTVYFEQPPSLIDYATTRTTTFAPNATYYFTVSLPSNAGEPLERVTIEQRDSSTLARRVDYRVDATYAFVGTRQSQGDSRRSLPLGTVAYDRDTQAIAITFDPPVPPGTTATVALRPRRNPQLDGTYLFRVVAFPPAPENGSAHGQFLGFGRLRFDRPEFFRWW
ncbi:MAG: DUF2808 domain-containing protein [Cyanobacteria bacterium J069]